MDVIEMDHHVLPFKAAFLQLVSLKDALNDNAPLRSSWRPHVFTGCVERAQ